MYKGILFDMDGVLVNSEPLHMQAWNVVVADLDLSFPDEWFDPWIGTPDIKLAVFLEKEYSLAINAYELLHRKRECFDELSETELEVFAGIEEGLKKLQNIFGSNMAVATSSHTTEAEKILTSKGLRQYFNSVTGSDQVSNPKPHPEPYRKAAEKTGLSPQECIAIEDSALGVQSAHAAGCYVVSVQTTLPAEKLQAYSHVSVKDSVAAIDWVMKNYS